jgi:transcriptional regulator with XRE-family HTH domain
MYNTEEKCMELSEKLKKICVAKGSTPYKLAKKAGLSSSTISGFLKGKSKPRIDTLLIICNQLEISMTDFLDERGRMEKYVKEEEELVTVYRSLSDEKRKQLNIYLKMLGEYNGRIDD